MLRGHRSIIFAVGLICLPHLGQAQQKAENEQGEAATQQQPAQTLPIPLPIEIVENDAEADARQSREAEARQREIDDLAAQQGMNAATQAMNSATQRMAEYSFWSTVLVSIGTALLFANLWLMRQTNSAAVAAAVAAEHSNSILRADQRPWLTLQREFGCEFTLHSESRAVVKWDYTLHNHGKTPALDVAVRTSLARCDDILAGGDLVRKALKDARTDALERVAKRVVFPGETTLPFNGRIGQTFDVPGKRYLLLSCLTYRGAGIEDVGVEARVFLISQEADEGGDAKGWVLREDPSAAIIE